MKGLTVFFFLFVIQLSCRADPPNFIFILADDLGYGDVGCYGATDIETPHLDRLAREGLRFTDAYANGAVCSPTRIAFLTGRYQQHYGMDNALYYQETGRGLPEDGETIADRLQEAGYTTGLSGKWHLGYDTERQPLQQGFNHFFGLLGGNHHYFEHMDRIGVHDLWQGNETVHREGYSTDLITEDAVSFIRAHREGPFFLFLSHAAPHFPWQGPDDKDKDIRPKHKSWQIGDRETYIAMVESMDEGIGQVLEVLDELNLADNTIVVFTSDNGGHTYSSNAPLRGEKATLWEGGIRVPCLVRWPERIEANTTTEQVAITMDWTATFAALAGEPAISSSDEGIDLSSILTKEAKPVPRTLFWRQQPGPRRKSVPVTQAVRDGAWKYYHDDSGETFLFNLATDLSETDNVASEHPDMVETLRKRHFEWARQFDSNQ